MIRSIGQKTDIVKTEQIFGMERDKCDERSNILIIYFLLIWQKLHFRGNVATTF